MIRYCMGAPGTFLMPATVAWGSGNAMASKDVATSPPAAIRFAPVDAKAIQTRPTSAQEGANSRMLHGVIIWVRTEIGRAD